MNMPRSRRTTAAILLPTTTPVLAPNTGLLEQLNTTQDSYLHFARIPSHDEEESYFSIPLAESAIIDAEATRTTTTATTIQFPAPAESTSPASFEKENTIFVGEMLLSNLTDADDDDDDDEEVLLSNVSSEEAPSIALAAEQAAQ
jgi:hypothetical protein